MLRSIALCTLCVIGAIFFAGIAVAGSYYAITFITPHMHRMPPAAFAGCVIVYVVFLFFTLCPAYLCGGLAGDYAHDYADASDKRHRYMRRRAILSR